jgi:Carbohydrate binding module (family 6)
MRKYKFSLVLIAGLCFLLACSSAKGQQAFGYTSITYNEATNTATGYASTELDYETAYYYDAEVEAHIEDENGNILGTGQASGNPVASTFFDVVSIVFCFRFSIVSRVIVAPHFIGCNGGYFDIFGFSDFWFGWWWDFGDFSFERRNRCIFQRIVFIAFIIRDIVRCLPVDVICYKIPDTNLLLPSGLSPRSATPYLVGLIPQVNDADHINIACRATRKFTGQPQSGVQIQFGFGDAPSGGGHAHTQGARPRGSFSPPVVPTGSDGWATSTYTAPIFSGTTQILMTVDGEEVSRANMEIQVANLHRLANPANTEGYLMIGDRAVHPDGHYGTADANEGLRQIAADYRNNAFPNGQTDAGKLNYNDQSLVRGGKFDLSATWQPADDHDEHRVGINCDVSNHNVPPDNIVVNGQSVRRRDFLEERFFFRGSTRTGREFNRRHWHLRFYFNNPPPAAAAGSVPADGVATTVPGVIDVERHDTTGDDGTEGSFVPDGATDPMYNYPQVLLIPGNEDQTYVPMAGGQWMKYTVNVASSGSYSFMTRAGSLSNGNTFRFEVDGIDRTGPISIPYTGSAAVYDFVSVNDIWLDAGQHVIRLVVDGSGQALGNFDYITINPYYPPQFCNPEWWQIQDCQNGGGSWDYGLCGCQYYGCYNQWCNVY